MHFPNPEPIRIVRPGRRVINHPVQPHYSSLAQYERDHQAALADPQSFWSSRARELLHWQTPFTVALEGGFSSTAEPLRWFSDGTLNVAENCIDRHIRAGHGDDLAIIWEGDEPGTNRRYTFSQLLHEVILTCRLLRTNFPTLKPGDTVTVYMPMIPETVFVMLACARLGLVHNVVFAGFSAEALRDRIVDAQSSLVITAEYGMRGGKRIPLRSLVQEALSREATEGIVKDVLVYERDSAEAHDSEGSLHYRTHFYSQLARKLSSSSDSDSNADSLDHFPAEHPLFMLYTSGSTGRPKGLLHTSAGYLLYAAFTARNSFDLHRGDVFGCLADVGWITGHSYIVYGPLALGITTVLFESIPTYPTPSRYW